MILITKYSNSELIYNYLNHQLFKSKDDFNMDPINCYFNIKYRSVIFTEKNNIVLIPDLVII